MTEIKQNLRIPLFVCLDAEPDDKLGLAILALSKKWTFDTIVVGERDAAKSLAVTKRYFEQVDIFKQDKMPNFVQGLGSSVVFDDEGKEFDNFEFKSDQKDQEKDKKSIVENYKHHLTEFLTRNQEKGPTMLIQKPCRELFQIWPELTKLLSNTTLYMYGKSYGFFM